LKTIQQEDDMLEMKPWYQSKTVWGALIAIAASLLGRAGLEIGGAEQAEIAEALTTLAGTVGGLLALYGRLTATKGVGG
jgi:hypothetical protein